MPGRAAVIMEHLAKLFVCSLICVFGISESEKESIHFSGTINKVGLAGQDIIVAGDGLLTSISTKTFIKTPITSVGSKNYSFLSTGNGNLFLACSADMNKALCLQCVHTTCKKEITLPLHVMRSFCFLHSNRVMHFIISPTTTDRTYISVWNSLGTSEDAVLRLKSDWAYDVAAVSERNENQFYGLAKSVKDNVERNIMFELANSGPRGLDYEQIFTENIGQAVSFISGIRFPDFFFLTTANRIGKITWNGATNSDTPFELVGRPRRKWVLKVGENSLPVTEVKGVLKELRENENVTGGLMTTAPKRLFLATDHGRLLKFAMDNDTHVTLKYNITIPEKPNAQIFLITEKNKYLYGYIRHSSRISEIFRTEVHDCKRHVACGTCLAPVADPDCGWFPLENTCRFDSSLASGKVATCPEIRTLVPPAVSMEKKNQVNITLAHVQPTSLRDQKLECQWIFPNLNETTPASVQNNFLVCQTPTVDIKNVGRESTDVSLWVLINGNMLTEKKKTIKFFDCRYFRSCTLCQRPHSLVGENFNCTWISGESNCVRTQRGSSPAMCPWLEDPRMEAELLIPNGNRWNLSLKGKQLQELQNSDFKCYINQRVFDFRIWNDTHADCYSPNAVDFSPSTFKTFADLTVFSNATGIIVGVETRWSLNVTIYECSYLACDICLLEEQKGLLCRSTTRAKCETGKRTQPLLPPYCTKNPVVKKLSPKNGPLEGGTRVSVSGNWLGLNVVQLTGRVDLAGLKCEKVKVIEALKSFECTTVASNKPVNGSLKVWKIDTRATFSYMTVSAPVNVSSYFCFTDFPGAFNVTIPNYHIGRWRKISVAGIDLTNQTKRIGLSNVYRIQCPRSVVPFTESKKKGKIVVIVDGSERMSEKDFEFLPAPFLLTGSSSGFNSILSGGVRLIFPASNSFRLSNASIKIRSLSAWRPCLLNTTGIVCEAPKGRKDFFGILMLQTIPNVNFMRGRNLTIKYFPDPELVLLQNTTTVKGDELILEAESKSNLLRGATKDDYRVTLEGKECKIIRVSERYITCNIGTLSEADRQSAITVKVFIGSWLNYTLGVVRFVEESGPWLTIVFPIIATFLFLAVGCFLGFLLYRRRRDSLQKKYREELDKRMEEEHFAAANASRNAFVEMQTAMEGMHLLDTNAELPYRDFEDFMVAVLLPNPSGKAEALAEFEHCVKSDPAALPIPDLIERFNSQLLSEKPFLLTLIRTFDGSTKLADKSLIAAALSIILADRMEYYYEVLRELFHHIVKTNVEERKTDSLTLLFRRSESLMEKMFSNWLTICLYSHLRNSDTGKRLYIVFKALGKFLDMGPVDALRCRAKNVLSEDVLLSEEIDFYVITLRGSLKDEEGQSDPVELQVLSCDTIGQVKEKIIEALFPHRPFSMRPAAEDFVLQWQRSTGADGSNAFFLHIETQLTSTSNKLPVIGDLNAKDVLLGAHLVLVRLSQAGKMSMGGSLSSFASEADDSTNLLARDSLGEPIHLCQGNTTVNQTGISKDFCLPHLLKTRHVVHTYIDDLFKSIFNIDIMEPPPPYVEHIFGVIDDAISEVHHDREMMAHVWKSNSYILRVWVNLLKNPEFLFDVNKSLVVNANLSVIAQALMDACSYNPKPTSQKGLSSTKLVFLRDIEQYRKWVCEFYSKLETKKTLPSDQDMSMLYHAMRNTCKFNGDIVFSATRFLFMKSRDLKAKILDSIDGSQWFHTHEERQNFKYKMEAILGSTCSDTMV